LQEPALPISQGAAINTRPPPIIGVVIFIEDIVIAMYIILAVHINIFIGVI
jgi:hypothetical protein